MQGSLRPLLLTLGAATAGFWWLVLEYMRTTEALTQRLLRVVPDPAAFDALRMAPALYKPFLFVMGGVWSLLLVLAITLSWRRRLPG